MNSKKRSSKNLKITTRITIAAVIGIIVPLIIILVFSSVFPAVMAQYFGFSSVTTNSYSMLNQIQWSQELSQITNELVSDSSQEEKISSIDEFVTPIEKLGSVIYIEGNSVPLYATTSKEAVISQASEIVDFNPENNLNYFGENGMVIVNHAKSKDTRYLIIIANRDYTVNDVTKRFEAQNISNIMFSKTGIIFFMIAAVFIIAIIIISFITSKTISKPLKELANGANEVSNGNLDYIIDYRSTNEIGMAVEAFNHMTERLKFSLERQSEIENSRKEMIAGVAHDLRTPLTSVKGYVEGLMDGIANTPEKQQQYLKTIYTSTLNMERLLDDLLTVSRLELGTIKLDKKPVNLNEFLHNMEEEISLVLTQKNFDYEFINNCDDDFVTLLDGDQFQRVIRNIISNSVKYSRKEVKGRISFAVQSYQKSAIISVSDNGIGIDKESMGRMFDAFFRADPARTKTSEGSGIGLAVSKQIVELHDGKIWAASNEDGGVTILISLSRYIGEDKDE
ncbi:MAG: HAMP domain-containing protein [Eubacterium sp.]|nr:HAMP domain-containing protein [Eubacterium sp.]